MKLPVYREPDFIGKYDRPFWEAHVQRVQLTNRVLELLGCGLISQNIAEGLYHLNTSPGGMLQFAARMQGKQNLDWWIVEEASRYLDTHPERVDLILIAVRFSLVRHSKYENFWYTLDFYNIWKIIERFRSIDELFQYIRLNDNLDILHPWEVQDAVTIIKEAIK